MSISEERDSEPNDRRVRIDTKRWLMSKLLPKRYGDRVVHAGDPPAPITHLMGDIDFGKLSGPELDALERLCEARLAATLVTEDQAESNPDLSNNPCTELRPARTPRISR